MRATPNRDFAGFEVDKCITTAKYSRSSTDSTAEAGSKYGMRRQPANGDMQLRPERVSRHTPTAIDTTSVGARASQNVQIATPKVADRGPRQMSNVPRVSRHAIPR